MVFTIDLKIHAAAQFSSHLSKNLLICLFRTFFDFQTIRLYAR